MVVVSAVVVSAVVFLCGVTRFYLRGENLSRYDRVSSPGDASSRELSCEHLELLDLIEHTAEKRSGKSGPELLAAMRANLDAMGRKVDIGGVRLLPADIDGIPGEWVLAEGADPDRRFLYLHGGAFAMGSSRSHRAITSRLSNISGAAVLAVDYRLMPECRRLDGLEDCQKAYRWVLENGPGTKGAPQTLFVGGDSAGGNLTLVVIAWARDRGLRPADAVVALSPLTDATLSSGSIAANLESDHLLRRSHGYLLKIPSSIMLWLAWFHSRVRPCDPRVSPVHGDLSNLPPMLLHASEAEMLVDDSRRYVNKARASGSDATLETWDHMVHVWHIYVEKLPEAEEAFDKIAAFLEKHAPRSK